MANSISNVSTSTSGSSVQTDNTSKAGQAKDQLNSDMGTFLKMLTVQLKNQDPTSPLDSNQLTQQIIAFNQVEQAINTNANLEKLVNSSQNSQLSTAASLIGKEVQINGSQAKLTQGNAHFSYALPES